jgi:hypothetical protein
MGIDASVTPKLGRGTGIRRVTISILSSVAFNSRT